DLAAVRQRNWWHGYAGEALEASYRWGVPPQAVLDQAKALRQRLDAQASQQFPRPEFAAAKLLLVVGPAAITPGRLVPQDRSVVYIDAADGDGRVPIDSALLPGVSTWRLDCDHGSLPGAADAFGAYVELLERGDTARLERWQPSSARGAAEPARRRPSRRPQG